MRKRYIVLIAYALALVTLLGCVRLNQSSDKHAESLPSTEDFERLLSSACEDFFHELKIDAKQYCVEEYEVDATVDMPWDSVVSCTYGPGLGLIGSASGGRVFRICTMFVSEACGKLDGEEIAYLMSMLMIPVSLYDDHYSGYNAMLSLQKRIVDNGERNENSYSLEIDGIMYVITTTDSACFFELNVENYMCADEEDVVTDFGKVYLDVLKQTISEYPEYRSCCNYFLFDIDQDGMPELFVKIGTCEADYEYRVYRYAKLLKKAELISTLSGSHRVICGLNDQNGFLLVYRQQGCETITKCTYQNKKIHEELIFDQWLDNYHDFSLLPYYELDDYSGLNWIENPHDDNQSVLDNFSLEENRYDPYEGKIVIDNCPLIIDSTKYYWQDNDIFDRFYSEYFANSKASSWVHVGMKWETYIEESGVPSSTDVYKIVFDGGRESYYAVPFGEIQSPEVYRIDADGRLNLIWSAPMEEAYPWLEEHMDDIGSSKDNDYGEEDLTGTWWDMDSQRCNMSFEKNNDGSYYVEVEWSSSATESTEWYMNVEYNEERERYVYSDCQKVNVYFEGDELYVIDEYKRGTGSIIVYGDTLYWYDDQEHIRDGKLFEKAVSD